MYVAARTETGLVRDSNQDRYLVWQLGVDGGSRGGEFTFIAVADGMGGSAAGDRASTLTLTALSERILPLLVSRCGEEGLAPCDVPRLLAETVKTANLEVSQAARADASLKGMGTTLTAGLVTRGVLYLAQVGDSRCYRLRQGLLDQQTTDHSLVAELVRLGKLAPEAARNHPRRNVITRAIGVQETVEADVSCQVLEMGDLFLFCSDGLWELVPDDQLRDLIDPAAAAPEEVREAALRDACDHLVAAALAAGGEDNVTVILSLVEEKDLHPAASLDAQAFARTRVEPASNQEAALKRTLRYRLQEWQQ